MDCSSENVEENIKTYSTYRQEESTNQSEELTMDEIEQFEFHVYPNPSNTGRFTLLIPKNEKGKTNITVQNSYGQVVYLAKSNDGSVELDLSQSKKGMYFVKVNNGNEVKVERILFK